MKTRTCELRFANQLTNQTASLRTKVDIRNLHRFHGHRGKTIDITPEKP